MDRKKFAMNYGAVLGLALSLLGIIFWSMNINEQTSKVPSILNNALIIMFLAFAIVKYRDEEMNGILTYKQCLKLGTTISFFSSAVMSIYTYIYITYLNPEIITNSLELTQQTLLQSDPEISDEMLEVQLQYAAKFMQPHWMMIMTLLGGTIMGFFWSIVILWFWGIWLLFEKANQPGWYSLVPIVNIAALVRISGKRDWWIILYFVPFLNLIVHYIIMNELRKCFRKDDRYTIALFFLYFIYLPRLGLNNDEYKSPNNTQYDY